jgi:hypothetical protein
MTALSLLGADVQPYDATVLGLDPRDAEGARIARSLDGWAMTLLPRQRFQVERVTA